LAKELLFFCFKETWMPKRANATCSWYLFGSKNLEPLNVSSHHKEQK
jgi:hypothetical protein